MTGQVPNGPDPLAFFGGLTATGWEKATVKVASSLLMYTQRTVGSGSAAGMGEKKEGRSSNWSFIFSGLQNPESPSHASQQVRRRLFKTGMSTNANVFLRRDPYVLEPT